MTDRWTRIETLYEAALEQSAGRRKAWLTAACEDEDLRREILQMLAVSDRAVHFLEAPVLNGLMEEARGDGRIGAYRILQEIGRGGSSVVYLAERADGQYEQHVAIKVLCRVLDEGDMHRRFLAERQILAALDHPNIVPLLDGGVTPAGMPYLVLPYVRGRPLTEACAGLNLQRRLRLFVTICEAVQFAHRKLIVHRDLKPSNILVDESGMVKLLDFGIAKLLEPEAADLVPSTRTGWHLLTPEYASPEQVEGGAITTASDVYQLGLLLYEILTDRRAHEFETQSISEIARTVCDFDPPPPSKVAGGDFVRPRMLRGDLDAIALKALRKQPERRYGSAAELADDVRRYLARRTVTARPDSAVYRLGKAVRRNRAAAVASFLVLVLLVGYAVTATVQSRKIVAERNRAQESALRAERVQEFLIGLFEQADRDPAKSNRNIEAALTVLESAESRIDVELAKEPEVRADLLFTLGRIYAGFGRREQATLLMHRSLYLRRDLYGEPNEDVAAVLHGFGVQMLAHGDVDSARTYFGQAFEMRRKLHGNEDDPGLAASLLQTARLMPHDHPKKNELKEEAFAMYERLYGPRSVELAKAMHTFYVLGFGSKDPEEIIRGMRTVLSIFEQRLGVHLQTATVMHNLGLALGDKTEEGMDLVLRSVAVAEQAAGIQHPTTSQMVVNAAATLHELGRYQEADSLLTMALAVRRRTMSGTRGVAWSLMWYGRNLMAMDRLDEAETALREGFDIYRRVYPDSYLCHRLTYFFARCLMRRGKIDESTTLLEQRFNNCANAWGPDHRDYVPTLEALIEAQEAVGRPARATEYREILSRNS